MESRFQTIDACLHLKEQFLENSLQFCIFLQCAICLYFSIRNSFRCIFLAAVLLFFLPFFLCDCICMCFRTPFMCVLRQTISIFIYHLQRWLGPCHLKRSSSCRATKSYAANNNVYVWNKARRKTWRPFYLSINSFQLHFRIIALQPDEWGPPAATIGSAHRVKYRRE